MSTLFKRTMVAGINSGLEKESRIQWPSAKIAEEVVCKVADSLQGPDVLPEGGLSVTSAVKIANVLIEHARGYANVTPSSEYVTGVKTAASRDLGWVAEAAATAHMNKVAGESTIMAGGEHANTHQEAAKTDTLARLDLKNRPVGEYSVAQGASKMPKGGVVGEEMAHPKAPLSSPGLSSTVSQKAASDAELVQAGLESLPANLKTAAVAGLVSGNAKVIAGLKTAGARKLNKKANMDPAMLLQMLSQPQGHPEVEGKIPPEVAALIMQLMGGAEGGGAGAGAGAGLPPELGAMGGAPEGPPAAEEEPAGPPADEDKGGEDKEAAALFDYLNKVAEGGSLTQTGPNTLETAAKTDAMSELDKKNRPSGEYEVAQGKTEMTNSGHLGAAKTVADKAENPDTTITREQAKSAAEREYLARVQKLAEAAAPKLASMKSPAEKVAFLKQLAGPSPAELAALLNS